MLPASVLGSDTELQSLWVVVRGPSPWDVHQHPRDAVKRQEAAGGGRVREGSDTEQTGKGRVRRTQRVVWLPGHSADPAASPRPQRLRVRAGRCQTLRRLSPTPLPGDSARTGGDPVF